MPDAGFFKILGSVDSTNNYAMAIIHAGKAKHGMAFFANEQTAGKGQRGKTWEMQPGENIAMSLILNTDKLRLDEQFYLSMIIALATNDLLNKYAASETAIKWPNDLYWRDRKAAGVLIESVISTRNNFQPESVGNWKWAVVGIGVNINQTVFDASLRNPVSLKQITGKSYNVIALTKELYGLIIKRFDTLLNNEESQLHKEYQQHLYKINEKIKLKKENAVFETIIKGVNLHGQLITRDVMERIFNFGEVEWVL